MKRFVPVLAVLLLTNAGCFDFEGAYKACYDTQRCKETAAGAPVVVATVPAQRAENVEASTLIQITFDKAMEPTSVIATLTPAVNLIAPSWNTEGTTVTFTPESPLAFATSYTVRLEGKATDGGKLAATDIATFTVKAAPQGPTLVSSTPVNGANLVPLTIGLSLTFSAPVSPNGFVAITAPAVFLGNPQWASDQLTVTYPSASAYLPNTHYTVTFAGKGTDERAIVQPMPALAFDTVVDVVPPTVQSTTPANGATDVSVSAVPSLTFSEEMVPSSVLSSATVSPADAGCQWSIDSTNRILTCQHAAAFADDAGYTISIGAGATDLAGNHLQNAFSYNFKTGLAPDVTPPTVVSTTPSAGATGVDPAAPLSVSFSEPMDPASTQSALSMTSPSGTTKVNVNWSVDNKTVTFNLSPLPPLNTNVSWEIGTGAADTSGNTLAAAVSRTYKTWRLVTRTLPTDSTLDGDMYQTTTTTTEQGPRAVVGGTNNPTTFRVFFSFDMSPVFSDSPLAFQSASLDIYQDAHIDTRCTQSGCIADNYSPFQSVTAPAHGPVVVENVEYGTALDDTDWAVVPVAAGGLTTVALSRQFDTYNGLSTDLPHSANVLAWFTTQFSQWNGSAASADRYVQFRVRCTNETFTSSGVTWGRVALRTGENPNLPSTGLTVTYYAP